jgi:hypothetical protein
MRRLVVVLALLFAVSGVSIAFALPSSTVPDCPPRSSGVPCDNGTDTHPWARFLIGTAALVPGVVLIGARYRGNRRVAGAVLVAGTVCSVLLWWISGLIPTTRGDCPPYPRCYTMGHPYGGPAFIALLITAAIGFWLWQPILTEQTDV